MILAIEIMRMNSDTRVYVCVCVCEGGCGYSIFIKMIYQVPTIVADEPTYDMAG